MSTRWRSILAVFYPDPSGDTIEAPHTKSDLQVGMEALLGGQLPGTERG
jgi:hypothetical protein